MVNILTTSTFSLFNVFGDYMACDFYVKNSLNETRTHGASLNLSVDMQGLTVLSGHRYLLDATLTFHENKYSIQRKEI